MIKQCNMYLHSNKETNYELGKDELELNDKALDNFVYALYEVKFDVEVDTKTGEINILGIKYKDQILVPK